MKGSLIVFIVCLSLGLSIAQENKLSIDSMRTHDPATLQTHSGKYWLFSTGKGIKTVWSSDLENFTSADPVFAEGTWPEWVNKYVPDFKGHFWAPDVLFFNGKYHLYYSCSSFGKPTSAIGLVVNKTLDPSSQEYQWEDRGEVVTSSIKTDVNGIDPGFLKSKNGRVFLTFGSWHGGIAVGEIDTLSGKFIEPIDLKKIAGGNHEAWEAPALIQNGNDYFLLVNTGICCKGLESTYQIVMGKSDSPLGPFLDKEGIDLNLGGGSIFLSSAGRIHGPGHFSLSNEGKVGIHYYDTLDHGIPKYKIYELAFKDGWPRIIE